MKIRVVIIEDHKETRDMLELLISGNDAYDCIATYANSEDALMQVPLLQPDVALVDIHLPGASGTDCVRHLKVTCPATQFIMCTSLEDSDNIFNALQAGASGYLTKSTSPERILASIKDAHEGGAPMSSMIARKVISHFQQVETVKKNIELEKLSNREQEILSYLSKGYRYKEIAAMLFISIETVRKHIHNIYEKLQVDSRTDALNKVFSKN